MTTPLILENRHTGERLELDGITRPAVDLDRYLQAVFDVMNASPTGRPSLFYLAHVALRRAGRGRERKPGDRSTGWLVQHVDEHHRNRSNRNSNRED